MTGFWSSPVVDPFSTSDKTCCIPDNITIALDNAIITFNGTFQFNETNLQCLSLYQKSPGTFNVTPIYLFKDVTLENFNDADQNRGPETTSLASGGIVQWDFKLGYPFTSFLRLQNRSPCSFYMTTQKVSL